MPARTQGGQGQEAGMVTVHDWGGDSMVVWAELGAGPLQLSDFGQTINPLCSFCFLIHKRNTTISASQSGFEHWQCWMCYPSTLKKMCISLAASGPSCSTKGLCCGASVVAVSGPSRPAPCGPLVSWPGTEPLSLALEGGLPSTGPTGKSLSRFFLNDGSH